MSTPSPVTRPRGPLPARVYWFRRGLVGGLAVLLVVGLVALVSSFGGGGQPSGGDSAVTAAAPASPTPTPSRGVTPSPSASASPTAATPSASTAPRKARTALSAPTGLCDPKDVSVRATPKQTVGGSAVTIPLVLTTSGESCTLAVSAKTVVAKITSGSDRIWTSQDCPASIPSSSVTVRPAGEKPTAVNLTWSGRRSAEGCAGGTAWARAGSYHVVAATLGGEQSDSQFLLGVPPRPVVTKTAKPKPVATPKG